MTQDTIDMPRRDFLRAALGVLLAAGGLTGCTGASRATSGPELSGGWAAAMVGEREAAARLGRAYLAAFPAERDLRTLLGRLATALRGQGAAGAEVDFAALDRTVRDEYRRGEVVQLSGWVLSRSEARLYAAVSLL